MYYTIREEGRSEYTEKKSVFKGFIKRCTSEEEAREYIASVKSSERDIRHAVFAYTIGENSEIKRYSDDGEPQGTGGMPVLSVIEKNELKDVVIVVTRYFGGILLGASNLARAYGRAASDAAASVDKVRIDYGLQIDMTMSYDVFSKVERFLMDENIRICNREFLGEVEITVSIPEWEEKGFREKITDISLDRVIFKDTLRKKYYFSDSGITEEVTD